MAIHRTISASLAAVLWMAAAPSPASAQQAGSFTPPSLDMETGVATVRVLDQRATFGEIARAVQDRAVEFGERNSMTISEADFVLENPDRILYVCKDADTGRRRAARNPSVYYDRCEPERRSHWLVIGETYRIPFRTPAAEPPMPEPQADIMEPSPEPERAVETAPVVLPTASPSFAPAPPPRRPVSDRHAEAFQELFHVSAGAFVTTFVVLLLLAGYGIRKIVRLGAGLQAAAKEARAKEARIREQKRIAEFHKGEANALARQRNMFLQAFRRWCGMLGVTAVEPGPLLSTASIEFGAWESELQSLITNLSRTQQALGAQAAETQEIARIKEEAFARIRALEAELSAWHAQDREDRVRKEAIARLLARLKELKGRRSMFKRMHELVMRMWTDTVGTSIPSLSADSQIFGLEEERREKEARRELYRLVRELIAFRRPSSDAFDQALASVV